MDTVDSRTRGKISLHSSGSLTSSSVLSRRLLADVLLAIALNAGKDYLLAEVGVFWVLVRVLACGALAVVVWLVTSGQLQTKRFTEWSVVGMSSLLLFLRLAGLFTALYRLPSTRVILFIHFSPIWFRSLTGLTSVRRGSCILLSLTLSFLWDARFHPSNFGDCLPAYGALIVEAVCSTALEHTDSVLSPSLGPTMSEALSILGACVFSLPLYTLRHILLSDHSHPIPSLTALAVLPCLAYVILYLVPRSSISTNIAVTSPRYIVSSYVTTYVTAVVFGFLGFGHLPRFADFVVPAMLLYGMYPTTAEPSHGAASYYATTSRLARAYLKDILSSPESRKIFYFLMLNMGYMMVQMLYGIWTNSLGLISDAIHMAFDCMAIAVGLIASVMARWPPNERFTYGYGRIETLSGFANGIFLILISVFIVFEAIQRFHSHSHAPNPSNDTSNTHKSSAPTRPGLHSRHPSLETKVDPPSHLHLHPAHARLQAENSLPISPITPNYKFGHDDHFETHHSSGHAPNLHDHSHVHDHHEGHSDNMRGVFLHVMADTLGSVGVIVSTLLIQLYGWTGFDPIASLFIAILIAASVIPLVIDTGKVLALDLDSKEKSIRDALTELAPIEGLASYSSPRFWPKDSSSVIGTIHVQLSPSASSLDPGGPHSSTRTTTARVDRVVERVDKLLRNGISGLEELTIQVEDSTSHNHYAD
ncbi:cation efflux protein [Lentinus tigrinus ALCF2SS1-7]|uniref:cation efflux protein n=1 Tax=Lentinus tigrinus ALCF2SS1-7 TaxID=1328758 RepID=UPI001165E809|nr:cation efflux protein [Lentinus tigrinus ALCF2SS1-7]